MWNIPKLQADWANSLKYFFNGRWRSMEEPSSSDIWAMYEVSCLCCFFLVKYFLVILGKKWYLEDLQYGNSVKRKKNLMLTITLPLHLKMCTSSD